MKYSKSPKVVLSLLETGLPGSTDICVERYWDSDVILNISVCFDENYLKEGVEIQNKREFIVVSTPQSFVKQVFLFEDNYTTRSL